MYYNLFSEEISSWMRKCIRIVENNSVPTACVTLDSEDGYCIYVNSNFMDKLGTENKRKVILHELMHVVRGDCIIMRGIKQPELWNLASDCHINSAINNIEDLEREMGGLVVLYDRIREDDWPKELPSTKWIYETLLKEQNKNQVIVLIPSDGDNITGNSPSDNLTSGGGSGKSNNNSNKQNDDQDCEEKSNNDCSESSNSETDQNNDTCAGNGSSGISNSSRNASRGESKGESKDGEKGSQESGDNSDNLNKKYALSDDVIPAKGDLDKCKVFHAKTIMCAPRSFGIGAPPPSHVRRIFYKPVSDVKILNTIKRVIKNVVPRFGTVKVIRKTWAREHRTSDLLRGRARRRLVHVLLCLDVSGSMQPYVKDVIGIGQWIKSKMEVEVAVWADKAELATNEKFIPYVGDGTNIVECLKLIDKESPDVAVVITDGIFEEMKSSTKCPIVWVLYGDKSRRNILKKNRDIIIDGDSAHISLR